MNTSTTQIVIAPNKIVAHVTRYMTGACIEDVNHEVYGGIYSQMVYGESFVEPAPDPGTGSGGPVSGMWDPFAVGLAAGKYELEKKDILDSPQAQRIVFESGEGELGIANRGLNRWGMCFRKGKPYEGVLWVKSAKPVRLVLSLGSKDGKRRIAEEKIAVRAGDWSRIKFKLTPNEEEKDGRFAVALGEPGDVLIAYASLEPGSWGRFKGLPVRKDVGDALVKQGLTVLRMGGCMVNSPNYRLKEMMGPRDRRRPYQGFWHPHSSNGWGVIEFVDFCRAAGFLAIPDLNMGEKPGDVADFVEYMNGSVTSTWGAKRAADGHPKPYALKFLQLGNEEAIDDAYYGKFEPIAKAVWAKDPDITLVVGDFAYADEIKDPFDFTGGAAVKTLAVQQKILELARANDRPVWFDLHVGNDEPRQVDAPNGCYNGLRSYIGAMKKLCPGADFKVAVFEENAGNHQLRRGLGHARMIGALERVGDDVPIVCAANCLQPNGQNDNGWDQGLLFLSPTGVWGQSSYYVTQMISTHYLPYCVEARVAGGDGSLDVTAKKSPDGHILQLQVVNMSDQPVSATIDFGGWKPSKGSCEAVWIAGDWADVNTEADPKHIAPSEQKSKLDPKSTSLTHTFPARSFTILRLE